MALLTASAPESATELRYENSTKRGRPRTKGLFFEREQSRRDAGAIAGRAVEICENEGVQLVAPHF
jgi:hypothetical protein